MLPPACPVTTCAYVRSAPLTANQCSLNVRPELDDDGNARGIRRGVLAHRGKDAAIAIMRACVSAIGVTRCRSLSAVDRDGDRLVQARFRHRGFRRAGGRDLRRDGSPTVRLARATGSDLVRGQGVDRPYDRALDSVHGAHRLHAEHRVDLGGRRIIKKKNTTATTAPVRYVGVYPPPLLRPRLI